MKSYSFFFSALLALCLCACNTSVPDYGKSEEPVFRIVQDTLRLSVGQASLLSLSVPLSGVEWASSADSVAVVDWRGKVSAKSAGLSLITASRLSSSSEDSSSSSSADTSSSSQEFPSVVMSDTCIVLVLSSDASPDDSPSDSSPEDSPSDSSPEDSPSDSSSGDSPAE